MASTRRLVPMDIYQDPMPSYEESVYPAANMQPHMYPQHHPAALQPVPHYVQNRSPVYQQQMPNQPSFTPLKSHSTNSSPVMQMQAPPAFGAVYLAPPEMTGYSSGSPIKKTMQQQPHQQPHIPQYAAYYQPAAQKPQKALFNTFPTASRPTMEKENMYHHAMYESQIPHFAPPFPQPPQVLGKRSHEQDLLGSASRNAKRQRPDEEESIVLPEPEEMPGLRDDGGKPPFSYATLIGMAILRAPNRRLTLAQIYKWISDTFSWYRDAEPGWMNSIRHNLSLNKAFVKKERPKDDPGKGNYWAIEEGMEKQFLKDKTAPRRPTNPEPVYMVTEMARTVTSAPTMETFALPPKTTRTVDSSRFPQESENSSDATLPDDNKDDDAGMPPPPSRVVPSSPPHGLFDSSPPVHLPNHGTTPTLSRKPLPRKQESFKDSGFFSSIESSVSRPAHGGIVAEPDREDIRSSGLRGRGSGSGRAEEELARIRGSSYDPSPTRAKSAMDHRQYKDLAPPSSPTRTIDTIGFPPLTPAVKLNPSVQPQPPSTVSPNTHLRRHRENVRALVGTPAQNLPTYGVEELQWTPAFSLHHHDSDYSGTTPRFEPGSACTPNSASFSNTYGLLWNDDMSCGGGNIGSSGATPKSLRRASADAKTSNESTQSLGESYDVFFARGSPLKPQIKRPLIQRPASTGPTTTSTSNALASVTGSMAPPPLLSSGLGSPFRGSRPGAFQGHMRRISRGSKDFGASFVNSPLRRTEMAPGSDDAPVAPATPIRKSGLCSGITVNSPGDSLSIWDAYLAGLEDDEEDGTAFLMEESKDVEGLDLAKGFSSIGAAGTLAAPMTFAAPMPPQEKPVNVPAEVPIANAAAATGHLRRPSFMRRVTSNL